MNKLTLALLASAAALAIAPAAMAGTIPTGSFTLGSQVGSTYNTTLSTTGVPDPALNYTAGITESVYNYGSSGYLAFAYTVTYESGNDAVGSMSTNYGPYVDSKLTLEQVSGVGIALATDSPSAGTITLDFTGADLGTSDTDSFILFTDATSYGSGPVSLLDTDPAYGSALVPTPEPGSLMLLGTGLLGLAFVAFRKAKSTGMVLSM